MQTIAKTSSKKIAAIKSSVTRCVSHARSSDYVGQECSQDVAWERLASFRRAKLYQVSDGKWQIQIHAGE